MTDSKMPERIWADEADMRDGDGRPIRGDWWHVPSKNTEYIRADLAHPAPVADAELESGLIEELADAARWRRLPGNENHHATAALFERAVAYLRNQHRAMDAGAKNRRDTFDAMCAMRDAINEHIPMPSLESDLLQGPENSVFCAAVAEAVITALRARTAQPVGVRVRELEWGALRYTDDYSFASDAATPIGTYVATDTGWFLQGRTGWIDASNMDAAQAAAQADYEQRILSSLLTEGGA